MRAGDKSLARCTARDQAQQPVMKAAENVNADTEAAADFDAPRC